MGDIDWTIFAEAMISKSDALMADAGASSDSSEPIFAAALVCAAIGSAIKSSLPVPVQTAQSAAAPAGRDIRAEALARGYTGDICSDCGNATMLRNGTCLKCDTCGSTTGCS